MKSLIPLVKVLITSLFVVCLLSNLAVFAEIMPSSTDATDYNRQGLEYAKKGKLEDAREKFTEALDINPNFTQAQFNLGVVFERENKFDQAIYAYSKALALEPQNAMVHTALGYCYSKEKLWGQAISEYNAALNINPNYTLALKDLGEAYCTLKKWSLAKQEYNRLNELHSSYSSALSRLLPKSQTHKSISKIAVESPTPSINNSVKTALNPETSSLSDENQEASNVSQVAENQAEEFPSYHYGENATSEATETVYNDVSGSNTDSSSSSSLPFGVLFVGIAALSIIAGLIYFIPTIVAFNKGHINKWVIFLINLFLGFTFIGWFVALLMAVWKKEQASIHLHQHIDGSRSNSQSAGAENTDINKWSS